MADVRHVPDTLFIVAEEDWRLHAHEALPESAHGPVEPFATGAGAAPAGWQEVVNEAAAHTIEQLYDARLALCPLAGPERPPAVEMEGHAELVPGLPFYVRQGKPTPAELGHLPQELTDIVRICTAAHRDGRRGGLVWLGWDGANAQGKKRKPVHGALAFGITSLTARLMLQEFDLFEFRHFDLALIDVLMRNIAGARDRWGASYVWPSIGHYVGHISGCEVGLGWRLPEWEKSWIQEGTRKESREHHHRCVMGFTPSGLDYGAEIRLEEGFDDGLHWKTAWAVPEGKGQGKGSKGKGKEGRGPPIGARPEMGPHFVTYGSVATVSDRMRRTLRANLRDYNRRNFTSPAEAMPM